MDFNDSPEEARFRAEVRQWLADHAPQYELPEGVKLEDHEEVARGRAWQRAVYDGGYAGITFPKALGGRGGSVLEAVVYAEEERQYRLPKGPYMGIGLGMAINVIAKHGNDEQRARFIQATLRGDLTWCQLFSEPAAGSDLANLRTKAVKQGDHWIVNGQKLWSSWAHEADWGILVVRTDPSVPKHKGLTFFVLDMKSAGVDIRPIKQISGASDFNETFLTGVAIADSDRIGAVGEGWACCMTTLMSERLGAGVHKSSVEPIIDMAESGGAPMGDRTIDQGGGLAFELAQALAEEQASRHFESRLRTMVSRGENPGAMAAMVKLASASRSQRVSGLAFEVKGLAAVAPSAEEQDVTRAHGDYLWSTVLRIAGGADEVLRNQISERILNMPSEIRMDKDVPFEALR